MSRRRAYSDPTADQALRNIAEEAMREYEERHRRKSPDVIRDEESKVDDLVGYITGISEVIENDDTEGSIQCPLERNGTEYHRKES